MKQLEYSQLKGINQFYVFSHHPTAQQTPLISKIFNATTVGSVLKQGLKFYTGWQFDHIKIIIKKTSTGKEIQNKAEDSSVIRNSVPPLDFLYPNWKVQKQNAFATKKKNRQKSYLK